MNRMMWAVLLVKQKHQCQSFQAVIYKQPNLTVNYNLHSARLVLADMELCLSYVERVCPAPIWHSDEQITVNVPETFNWGLVLEKISGMRWK